MKTISLRYTDKFAPQIGTIEAHSKILKEKGYVWYGKLGLPVSQKVADMIMDNDNPMFLLIHSGSFERYWVHIDQISRLRPEYADFPEYYHKSADSFNTWFRVIRIETAEKGVMRKCIVISSGTSLSEASRHSMSPYFIIDYDNEKGDS